MTNPETKTKEKDRAEDQAKLQLESIVNMVKRLEHCRDCDGEDCELTNAELYAGLDLYYKKGNKATKEEREEYHDEEQARERIQEDPLSVQVRSGWANSPEAMEAEEFEILLCTGGPACRIVGELGQYNEPDRARIEYQDWFTPWVELVDISSEECEALLTYSQQFYFGN